MSGLHPTRIVLVVSALVMLGFVAFVSVPRPIVPGKDAFGDETPARIPTLPFVSALDWLPMNAVRDGSVDYTSYLQAAIDAATGRSLLLPDFPVRVSREPGSDRCLVARSPIEIVGGTSSRLVETEGGTSILRIEHAKGVRLRGFALRGRGGPNAGRDHALLTVEACSDVSIEDVSALDSDADGILVRASQRVSVRGSRVIRIARHGIWLDRCDGVVVADNQVEDGGSPAARLAADAGPAAGIRLSSCIDATCTGNVLRDGSGSGIVVDAAAGGAEPTSASLVANRVTGWRDARDPQRSAGILVRGSGARTVGRTLVAANTIERCGAHGLSIDGLDDVSLLGNVVIDSERAAIRVGASQGAQLLANVVVDADRSRSGGQAGILVTPEASGVVAHGNHVDAGTTTPPVPAVLDTGADGRNSIEPRVLRATAPPASGTWSRGDLVWNSAPWPGSPSGWVCTQDGVPGVWSVLGRIE